ncbi:MAG: hypothetical protein ACRDO1_01795 [Nocardioidaceae bacterium]
MRDEHMLAGRACRGLDAVLGECAQPGEHGEITGVSKRADPPFTPSRCAAVGKDDSGQDALPPAARRDPAADGRLGEAQGREICMRGDALT